MPSLLPEQRVSHCQLRHVTSSRVRRKRSSLRGKLMDLGKSRNRTGFWRCGWRQHHLTPRWLLAATQQNPPDNPELTAGARGGQRGCVHKHQKEQTFLPYLPVLTPRGVQKLRITNHAEAARSRGGQRNREHCKRRDVGSEPRLARGCLLHALRLVTDGLARFLHRAGSSSTSLLWHTPHTPPLLCCRAVTDGVTMTARGTCAGHRAAGAFSCHVPAIPKDGSCSLLPRPATLT